MNHPFPLLRDLFRGVVIRAAMLETVHEIWHGASIVEHRGPGWRFGSFRCAPDREAFREVNVSGRDALVVFPVYPVRVRELGRWPFIANRNVAVLRNPGAAYQLDALVPEGDACMWIAIDRAWLLALLGPTVEGRIEAPFSEPRRLLPARSWLIQHVALQLLHTGDGLGVPEALMALLEQTLAAPGLPSDDDRDLVHAAEEVLSTRYTEHLTLHEVAAAVGCTQWHLARVFRAQIGMTMHRYRDELRLRTALHRLRDPSQSVASLAYALGYSSHSHLSTRFRATFGVRPSAVRDAGRVELRRLSAMVKASGSSVVE